MWRLCCRCWTSCWSRRNDLFVPCQIPFGLSLSKPFHTPTTSTLRQAQGERNFWSSNDPRRRKKRKTARPHHRLRPRPAPRRCAGGQQPHDTGHHRHADRGRGAQGRPARRTGSRAGEPPARPGRVRRDVRRLLPQPRTGAATALADAAQGSASPASRRARPTRARPNSSSTPP